MAKPTSDTNNTIEALLQQRAQYEQWLTRLETAAADKAPAAVRERVRGDYEARLRGVIDELRGHAATIAEELELYRTDQSRLDGERQKAEEALAEAEVRYAVGEYSDEQWQRISQESEQHLDGLREELRVVEQEISRLAEVQSLIGAPARKPEAAVGATAAVAVAAAVEPPAEAAEPAPLAPAPAVPAAEPVAVPEPAAEAVSEAVREPAGEPVGAPRGASKPGTQPPTRPSEPVAAPAAAAAGPQDELAFLRSVSDEEPKPAAPPRRAGSPGAGVPAAAAKVSEPAAAPATTGGRPSGVAKTLKCTECGTLNRPTEWYCERCGAELAAL